ncbi:DsrE family protein [Sulfuriflexus mobilis]|uniref:DsrE family protein n=1 Tax=Sulfuriflexus mobilis TaxID=1811807 RepID=UPI001558BCCA|nr:DsrE family protein [Sulfuriflexus mobilis]
MKRILAMLVIVMPTMFVSDTLWAAPADTTAPVPFVMQLTRSGEGFSHRRALLQIAKVLDDIGEDKVHIEVVAYEGGILSLLKNNEQTAGLLAALNRRGVVFKACRISMRASELVDDDFPLEVEFVPAGAVEMIRLQMEGYRYWRP